MKKTNPKLLFLLILMIFFVLVTVFVLRLHRSSFPYAIPSNILLITVDALRADHLVHHGYPRETSPFLAAFSKRSVAFLDVSAQIPKTLPSMASMMTSRYADHIGVLANFHILSRDFPTLAEILRRHEFHTVAYTANANLIDDRGISRGFEEFSYQPMLAEKLTDRAIQWFDAHSHEKFFLWLHYNDPHGPYRPPKPFQDLFLDDPLYHPERRVSLNYEPMERYNKNFVLGAVPRYQQKHYQDHERKEETDFYISLYDGEIRSVDSQIQRLIEHLQEKILLDSTLVVFTSDHGEGLGEHNYYFEHGWFVYEHQIHVPLLMHFPGQLEGQIIHAPAGLLDLAPTLLDLLEIAVPRDFQGRSLMPLIRGERARTPPVYAVTPNVYPNRYRSLKAGGWKYIIDEAGREELYDLNSDPLETRNQVTGHPAKADFFRNLIGSAPWGGGVEGKPRALPPGTLDESVIKDLKSLGYLDDD